MAVNIGPKIGIDGEAQYRKELQNIIQSTKTLAAETNEAAAAFKNADDKQKASAAVKEKLNKQIEAQKQLIDKLEEAVGKSTDATGKNSTETLKWKEQLAKAKQGLSNLESQTKVTTGDVKELGAEEDRTSKKTSVFGDVLKANLAAAVIQKGLSITADIVKKIGDVFVDAIKGSAEYADEIDTLRRTTGLSTDTLQEYRYMSKLVDVELTTITGSMTKLIKNMSAARSGSKSQKEAFEQIGVAIADENGELRENTEVFDEVISKLREIKNPTERDAAAMAIFGKSAQELNPLIEKSAADLIELREEAHQVGAVLDEDTLSLLSEVNDEFDRVGLTWDAVKKKLGAKVGEKLLPDLEKGVKLLQDFADTGDIGPLIDGIYDAADDFITKALPELIDEAYKIFPELSKKLIKNAKKFVSSTLPKIIQNELPGALKSIGSVLGQLVGNIPEFLKAGVKLAGALIEGLVSAVPDMVREFGKALRESHLSQDAQDMISDFEKVREKLSEIPSETERIKKSLSDITGKQKEAERWIAIFDELSKKTKPTAAETERLKAAVDKLNELFPELGLKVDEETGKWNLNTAEIRTNIQAIGDRYKAEAYYAAASETLKEVAALERERDAQQDTTDKIESNIKKREELIKTLKNAKEELTALYEGWAKKSPEEQTDEAYIELEAALAKYGTRFTDVGVKIRELDGLIEESEKRLRDYNAEYDASKETLESYDKALADLNADVEWFFEQGDHWATEAEEVGEHVVKGIIKGMDGMKPTLANEAKGVIGAAIGAMKDEAQIKSPSKVTESLIGKNLAFGVIKGWDDVMDPAKLEGAFTMQPVFDAMTSGAVTNSTNYTTNLGGVVVNVYPEKGTDIDALTNTIMRKMQGAVDARKAVFA